MLVMFDDKCTEWEDNKEFNKKYVEHTINYLNTKLRLIGWISLNELYDSLGKDRELSAQVYGWNVYQYPDNDIKFEFVEMHDDGNNVRIMLKNIVKLL